jgi:DNA-binding GntR family transcriptional regulator
VPVAGPPGGDPTRNGEAMASGTTPAARRQAASRTRPRMQAIRAQNLSEQVADGIVRGIADGRFLPGDRLIEQEIASELGVSRFPVRSALKMLAKQGIVVLQPNHGARVINLDHAAAVQFAEIRCDVERRAARYAAERLKAEPKLVRELDRIVAAMRAAALRGDRAGVRDADMAFHAWIFHAAGNYLLQMMWEALAKHMRIVFSFGRERDNLEDVWAEHAALRDMIAAGDMERFGVELHRHLIDNNQALTGS